MAVIIKYTTGPVENEVNTGTAASVVFVKALNNSTSTARVRVKLFALNGPKRLVANRFFTLSSGASDFVELSVGSLFQYEVQIITDNKRLLPSVWGKTSSGRLLAAQRFATSELVKKFVKC